MHWLPSSAVGLPGLAVMLAGYGAFAIAVIVARRRAGPRDTRTSGRRDASSLIGIALQALGVGLVAFGPVHVALNPLGPPALLGAVATAALAAGAVGLFHAASRRMGHNWAIVASTRTDHALVTDGPFARVRNPIYLAIALLMAAIAVAYGHYRHLLAGVPVYMLGTILRVRVEERLLRATFGSTFDAYAARVARFVPGLF